MPAGLDTFYGHRTIGSPLQVPSQPYRPGAGVLWGTNATMYPQPLAYGGLSKFIHQAGGSQAGGVPTQNALTTRLGSLLALANARAQGSYNTSNSFLIPGSSIPGSGRVASKSRAARGGVPKGS